MNSTPPGFPAASMTDSGANAMALLDQSNLFLRQPVSAPQSHELTFPSDQPKSVIDWIVIPKAYEFTDYQVLPTTLSDHLPIVAGVTKSAK